MNVTSLGFRTDLALLTASGSVVEDRGTHLVVRTPDNPTYYWGNFILLAEPPVPGGEREVVGAFHTEFPEARHVSIGIDTPDLTPEARAAFEAAGLVVDVASVLTASELQPPREVEAEVRPLQSASDWESRARLSLAIEERDDEESHLRFARGRNVQEQSLIDAGRGTRFGVLVDERGRQHRSRLHHRGRASRASRASRRTATTDARGWRPRPCTRRVATPSSTSARGRS